MVSPGLGMGLGRVPAPDTNDLAYAIEIRRLPPRPVHRVSKTWAYFRKPLNQGGEGTCVGHGWWHWLMTSPIIQVSKYPLARDIYIACTGVDEFPQNDGPDFQFGTSVRAGGKVLKSRGLVSEYNSTTDVYTMADWIGGKDSDGHFVGGPLVIGVNWYDGMFAPDAEGFIKPSGQVQGGHCVCLLGWNEKDGVFSGINSWGSDWGPKKGRFKIDAGDMHVLMTQGGEAWTAVELRLPVG